MSAPIGKCIALISSDRPGERTAAVEAADKLLRQAGLTWLDVGRLVEAEMARLQAGAAWRSAARWCLAHDLPLHELDFLTSVLQYPAARDLSERQAAWLDGIVRRLHREAAS